MTDGEASQRGLSAGELSRVVAELQPLLGCEVLDVAPLRRGDDLLVVLQGQERRHKLHLAPGGRRARITTTRRRFAKTDFATGPRTDFLRRVLVGADLHGISQPPGERCCTLELRGGGDLWRLHVELFGPRGLWCLVDAQGIVREQSRPLRTKARTFGIGDPYAPPPPAPAAGPPPESAQTPDRFPPPVLEAVDEHFTASDLAAEQDAERAALERVLDKALRRCRERLEGLEQGLEEAGGAGRLRADADLLLAYAHLVTRGAGEVELPDPESQGATRTLRLEPGLPPHEQARAWYDRARRLEQGVEVARRRLAEAERELEALAGLVGEDDPENLRAALRELGHLPAPPPPPRQTQKARKQSAGEEFRRFTSAEGYPIWVGRNNAQNDRLTLRAARGNDVWLHAGGGRAGSHVVVRLPKGKTASLETMLDAATLAVHFSKARGETACDVIYTQAKHVRKPKGLPPGAVVPSRTKTITVRRDEARLKRLLEDAGQ